jgi:hypothetical protein
MCKNLLQFFSKYTKIDKHNALLWKKLNKSFLFQSHTDEDLPAVNVWCGEKQQIQKLKLKILPHFSESTVLYLFS